jgi:starvation-inducible DNA-binding protein
VVDGRSGDEYKLGVAPVMDHLEALSQVYERVGAGHREAMEQVEALDMVSQDILIGQTRQLEMNHWFVRAHFPESD